MSSNAVSSRESSRKAISKIVISAMMLSLAILMEFISTLIPFFKWPSGGSVSLTMVPLMLVGLYCGPMYGFVISICFGIINFLFDGVIGWTSNTLAVILSLLLDYVIGFGVCGLSFLFRKQFYEKKITALIYSCVLCCFLRFVSSFFSGMIVFTQQFNYDSTSGLNMDFSAGGFVYSLVYNGGYMLPSLIVDLICMISLAKPLFSVMNISVVKNIAVKNEEKESFISSLSYQKLMPLFLIFSFGLGIVSSIPYFKISFFGYFGLILSVCLTSYEVYLLIKNFTDKDKNKQELIINISFLILSLVSLAVSLLGILSAYTYGSITYNS